MIDSWVKVFQNKNFIILNICFVLLIFLTGLLTDVRFSDEIFHFWFAKEWYIKGERPVYNKLVDTVNEFDYYRYYVNAPLWHYGLKSIFHLSGGNSTKEIAQVYMVIWYILLVFGVYLLGKTIYDEQVGIYAGFIIATMPFIVSFSILFFIDVPIAATAPFLIYFIIKERYFISGILMGIMFLLKENSYFLLPAGCVLLLANLNGKPVRFSKRYLYIILFLFLVFMMTFPNFRFRLRNFKGILVPNDHGAILTVVHNLFNESYLSIHNMVSKPKEEKPKEEKPKEEKPKEEKLKEEKLKEEKPKVKNYLTSSLTSFSTLLKYFGILFPLLFLWRMISILKYRDFNKKEVFIIIPVLIYIPFYIIAFQGWWDIRYLSPIIPLFSVFSVKNISSFKKKIRSIIVVIGVLMFLSTIVFVSIERQITLPEKEIIGYLKQLPEGRILTPEELFTSYYTDKPTIWSNSFTYTPGAGLYEIFWGEVKIKAEILRGFKIKYILIPHKRVYDDTKVRHFGGYPKSFVEEIKNMPFVEDIYNNEYASLWRVSL